MLPNGHVFTRFCSKLKLWNTNLFKNVMFLTLLTTTITNKILPISSYIRNDCHMCTVFCLLCNTFLFSSPAPSVHKKHVGTCICRKKLTSIQSCHIQNFFGSSKDQDKIIVAFSLSTCSNFLLNFLTLVVHECTVHRRHAKIL